ncbi:hypothetical protein ACFFIX_19155 [Metabacillus herbersteinensis]|uniref:PepSY domain-containing protein n=1 Tax=Metabacillus herbersteinensis TaxID=283816 RepID=A0ABV6GIK5_9BACI
MKQKTPAYVLEYAVYGYSNRTIDLQVNTSNGHFITLDGKNGEVKDFTGSLDKVKDLNFSDIEKEILQMKQVDEKEWERFREQSSWLWREKSNDQSNLHFTHSFGYTEGEAHFSYSESIDYLKFRPSSTKNDTREAAYKAVEKANGNEKIYAKRAKLTHVIDNNDTIREAWLVVIQPVGKAEHRLYLVDVETQKVDAIYE